MNVMVLFFDFGLTKCVKNPVVIEIRLEPRASNWLAALPPEFCKLYDEKAWYGYVIFFQNTRAMTASDEFAWKYTRCSNLSKLQYWNI